MVFYDRLQLCCEKSNTTVTALLKTIGLSTSKGTAWKNGSVPKSDVLYKLAAALHTTPAYLMGETDDPEIKKEPATSKGDGLENQLIAFYGEVKPYLDEDDLNDIKIFMQMKADYKKRKMMENHDKG